MGGCKALEENYCQCRRKCQSDCRHHSPINRQLVKDCTCAAWSIPSGKRQTIFNVNGFRRFFSSGFIAYDLGGSDHIIVRLFLGNREIGSPIEVFKESSFAFSFTMFDRITVECVGGTPGSICEGEICINSIYPI